MTKHYRPELERVDYSEEGTRWVCRKGNLVYKRDKDRLGLPWRTQMEQILEVWDIPGFEGFFEGGYVTRYVSGSDLHGNPPFTMDGSVFSSILSVEQRVGVLPIFGMASLVGAKLGFTFGDITCGNMMTDGMNIFLTDYDVVVPWPLDLSHLTIWNNTLQTIFRI